MVLPGGSPTPKTERAQTALTAANELARDKLSHHVVTLSTRDNTLQTKEKKPKEPSTTQARKVKTTDTSKKLSDKIETTNWVCAHCNAVNH